MHLNKIRRVQTHSTPFWIMLLLLSLLFNGCATRPWTSQVTEDETAFFTLTFEKMQQRDASCFSCLDAETTLFWDGPANDRSITGFLQLMLPASLKFVVINPLGQPLYALVSDGQEFQSINTSLKLHTIGTLSSLATQYEIPETLLSENWGYWLTGRLQEKGASIETIRRDGSGRGVWITMRYQGETTLARSHLLIQPETRQLLTRILVDTEGKTIATISYDERSEEDDCAPVSRVTISDLPYRSKLSISFTKILNECSFTAANFKLKVPRDYTIQEHR